MAAIEKFVGRQERVEEAVAAVGEHFAAADHHVARRRCALAVALAGRVERFRQAGIERVGECLPLPGDERAARARSPG